MAKSAVARGASMAASVWNKLDGKVKAKGGTEDAIHVLDKPDGDGLLEAIADLLVRAELKTRNRFTVTVDYSKPLETMVVEGKYHYVNPNVTCQNFPITGSGVVEEEIILVHFDRDIGSDDAVRELNEMCLKPARIEHATVFGAKYPDVQREYSVVFLGSDCSCSGHRHVSYLHKYSRGRFLDLLCWDGEWIASCRFAAVRKPPVLLSLGTLRL